MKALKIFSLVAALFMNACGMKADNSNVEVVSPQQFREKLAENANAYLIDARTPDEYAEGHLEGAHLMDWLDASSFKKQALDLDKSKTIYIYCRSGKRSNAAANYLASQGYKVVDMAGGILAWQRANLPVTSK